MADMPYGNKHFGMIGLSQIYIKDQDLSHFYHRLKAKLLTKALSHHCFRLIENQIEKHSVNVIKKKNEGVFDCYFLT